MHSWAIATLFAIIVIVWSGSLGCGHCKQFTPVYEEIGDAFANVGDVVIAKVDADGERDLGSRFGITGFPTLKFFPKGSKEPEE